MVGAPNGSADAAGAGVLPKSNAPPVAAGAGVGAPNPNGSADGAGAGVDPKSNALPAAGAGAGAEAPKPNGSAVLAGAAAGVLPKSKPPELPVVLLPKSNAMLNAVLVRPLVKNFQKFDFRPFEMFLFKKKKKVYEYFVFKILNPWCSRCCFCQ